MAQYLVRGRPKPDRVEDLRRRLAERAFAHMNPFGRELARSLRRARVRDLPSLFPELAAAPE